MSNSLLLVPKISVVMPVYNGEKYLREAIESILDQTYQDFEFIMVNDASTDGSGSILSEFANLDQRIRILTNESNLGIAGATNRGIAQARGEYIALMDQDDISLPERFEKQVEFLSNHPDISVLGTNSIILEEDGTYHYRRDVLETPGVNPLGINVSEIKSRIHPH